MRGSKPEQSLASRGKPWRAPANPPKARRAGRLGFGVSAWVLSWSVAGSAPATPLEAIGIEYTAFAACPSSEEFRRQVFERTDNARYSRDAASRTFVVRLDDAGSEVTGSLVVRDEGGEETVARTLSGSNCAEVALGLALATALAIDPNAPFSPRAETGASDQPEPEPPPEQRPETPAPSRDDEPTPVPKADSEWKTGLALGPLVETGFAPKAGFGGTLLVERRRVKHLSPIDSFGLDASFAMTEADPVSGATSTFQLVNVRPNLCAVPLPSDSALYLVPCVGAEVGAVFAAGSDLPNPKDATRFWAAGTLGLRVVAEMDQTWFADLDIAATVPFTRYRFIFETPETRVHQVPTLALRAALRVGLRF